MRHIISILFLLPLTFCAGCGTIITHVPGINDPDVPTTGTYRGVRFNIVQLKNLGGAGPFTIIAVFPFVDVPVSAIADTFIYFHDLKKLKEEDKPNPEPTRAQMSVRKQIFDDSELWAQLEHLTSGGPLNSNGAGPKRFRIRVYTLEDVTDTKNGVDVGGKAWVSEDQGAEQLYSLVISLPQDMLRGQKRDISIEKLQVNEAKHSVTLVVRVAARK